MASIRRQALLALPVLAAINPVSGAFAQGQTIYVPTPVAVAVPYTQAPYNNPYIYNNSGWGASYRAPVQVAQPVIAPSISNGAGLAGTVGSGTWDGVGGSGYSYVAAAQNAGGQATTYGVGNNGPLGNNQAYATNVANPGGGASLYGTSSQTATGQAYSTGATFANTYGSGSVSASGAQGAGGSSFGAAAGMTNAFGSGTATGSGTQGLYSNNFTTGANYTGSYGSGSASGNGGQTPAGNVWNSAANVGNGAASAGVTGAGVYNPAGNSGYTGTGSLNNGAGTGYSQSSGYANNNGSGGYQGATAVLGYGGAVPSNWLSAGSQLNQGGYYYGGPVTVVPQYQQQHAVYQPTYGYTAGYVPAYRQPTTVVYNPTFVVQQPTPVYAYYGSPVVPFGGVYFGPENSGANPEIGSGM